MSGPADVARAATAICAPGTDHDALAAVLTWLCGPGHRADALRRRIRDADRADDVPPAQRLASLARSDGPLDGPYNTKCHGNTHPYHNFKISIKIFFIHFYSPNILI